MSRKRRRATNKGARHYVLKAKSGKFSVLGNEIYTAVVRYFAPVVAIYEELEKTAGIIPPALWQRKKESNISKHD